MNLLTLCQQAPERALLTPEQLKRDPSALACCSVQELMQQTEATLLLLEGGDRSWMEDESTVEARYYASNDSRFIRKTGDTECTHAMGTADLLFNMDRLDGFTKTATVISDFGKTEAAFAGYNHDRIENNRGIVTPETIVTTCWQGAFLSEKRLIWALTQISDSPELSGKVRMQEQIDRANADSTGFLGVLRILEKQETLNRELHNARQGRIPFGGNMAKTKEYLSLRIDTIDAIRSRGSRPVRNLYLNTALELTNALHRIERSRNNKQNNYWFVPSGLVSAGCDLALHALRLCDRKKTLKLRLGALAP